MLEHRLLLESPIARVTAVRCPGGHRAWGPEEEVTGAAVVLLRRGVFLRRADGRRALADAVTGYVQRPGECQQIAHPGGGDVCTTISVPDDVADRFAHAGRVTVPPAADLAHRRLLAASAAGPVNGAGAGAGAANAAGVAWAVGTAGAASADAAAAAEAGETDAADLVAELISALLPPGPATRPPPDAIDDVRALLHADPARELADLAAAVGWSPWHLSRMFHRATGHTLGTYRRRLRVRAALDEITGATTGLAAVAVRSGFADQAHMTRAVRAETGTTPAALRRGTGRPFPDIPRKVIK